MQTATVIGASPRQFVGANYPDGGWLVNISYTPDAGGTQQAQILVGGDLPTALGYWSAANATIQAIVPGCANPVLVPCPDIIKWTLFEASVRGIPFQ
jgi:hypothetical protein